MPDYEGTAQAYDRYRRRYPTELIERLVDEVPLDHTSIVVDLACGTGQVAFALARTVQQVIAIDLEPDAVAQLEVQAATDGVVNVVASVGDAATADLPGAVDAITVGNGFHRLDRPAVAAKALDVLRPGGCLALLWGDMPWVGHTDWQLTLAEVVQEWRQALTGDSAALRRPAPEASHDHVIAEAGLTYLGKTEFLEATSWTFASLLGLVHSTSFLNQRVLGDQAKAFADDLRTHMEPLAADGRFEAEVSYALELARTPA